MEHYYTKNPNISSAEKQITSYINNNRYSFYTDNGVFSKNEVDFGTKSLLEAFYTNKENAKVCDLGCGYGVVTIYLGIKYPNFSFTMIDVNNRSLELSAKNINLNQLKNNIKLYENDALDSIEEKFDIVITNPPIRAGKQVVHKMIAQSYDRLNIDGELWVVIQKKQGMPSCKKLMEQLFENVEVVNRNKGYYTLKSIKNK